MKVLYLNNQNQISETNLIDTGKSFKFSINEDYLIISIFIDGISQTSKTFNALEQYFCKHGLNFNTSINKRLFNHANDVIINKSDFIPLN